jgi:hypothetical protein
MMLFSVGGIGNGDSMIVMAMTMVITADAKHIECLFELMKMSQI